MSKNIVEPDDTLHTFAAEILRRNEIIGIATAGDVHLDVEFVRVAMRTSCVGPMSSTEPCSRVQPWFARQCCP